MGQSQSPSMLERFPEDSCKRISVGKTVAGISCPTTTFLGVGFVSVLTLFFTHRQPPPYDWGGLSGRLAGRQAGEKRINYNDLTATSLE